MLLFYELYLEKLSVAEIEHSVGDKLMNENEALMEWYWQSKPDALGDKPVLVPLCPSGVITICNLTEQLTDTLKTIQK